MSCCERLAIALVAALVMLCAGSALARPPHPPPDGGRRPPPPMDRVLDRYAERLGLDAETQARIDALSRESRSARRTSHERLRALHDEMRALLAAEETDEAAVMRQAERIGAEEVELEKQRLRSMIHIRELLTPEQRAELVKISQENEGSERRGERGEGGRRPPPHHRPPPPRY